MAGRRRTGRAMARWRACAAITLLFTCLHSAAATCPTFVAWLSSNKNVHSQAVPSAGYSNGFVALTVAPDGKSVTINWQLTGTAASVQMIQAGIFGPATKDQVKPMTAGVLLDMGIMNPTNGQTLTIRKKVTSGKMAEILGYMREGLAYVNVMTTQHTSGEVRGQLVVPHCMDGELTGADHYGFTNIMMSPDQQDKSVAIAVQASPDTTGLTAELTLTSPTMPSPLHVPVLNEIKADASVDAGLQYHVIYNHTGTWTAFTSAGQKVNVVARHLGAVKLMGQVSKALSCRVLSSVEDTLFNTANEFGSDWLSIWSMNSGNPDQRRTLTPRYYAHPLEVTSGETAEAIMRRFGISERELARVNPAVVDLQSLSVGDTLCVVPNFLQTTGGNGAKICF